MKTRMLIVELQDKQGNWIVEGDMPLNEQSCEDVAKRNGMMNAVRVAIALASGDTIYIGLPHAQKRVKLKPLDKAETAKRENIAFLRDCITAKEDEFHANDEEFGDYTDEDIAAHNASCEAASAFLDTLEA